MSKGHLPLSTSSILSRSCWGKKKMYLKKKVYLGECTAPRQIGTPSSPAPSPSPFFQPNSPRSLLVYGKLWDQNSELAKPFTELCGRTFILDTVALAAASVNMTSQGRCVFGEEGVEVFELRRSTWDVILEQCPRGEVEEIKRVLGTSLVEQVVDLQEEVCHVLYRCWPSHCY